MSKHTITNLRELEDVAPKFGLEQIHEARFATKELGSEQSGLAYYRIKPGRRQPFGHRHRDEEEVYVVVAGSGRVKLDDEIVSLVQWDAVRVGPETMRSFEAGSDGIEIIAFGARGLGVEDVETAPNWWSE
jgi:mannose-6-phosphate isomerase-like protein (cupin superfamily)